MNTGASKLGPLGFMLVGALGMLILIAAGWGAMGLLRRDQTPPPPAVASADAKPDLPPVSEPSEPDSGPAETVNEPVAEEGKDSGQPAEAKPPEGDKRTLEEILEEKARKSAEELAKAAAEDDGFEADRAYLEANFLKRKEQMLKIIDGYYEHPDEQRDDYLRGALEKLRREAEADRQAAGLPAQPRNQRRMWQEFMGMIGENSSEQEKTQIKTFLGDVMQRRFARFQAQFERQINGPAAE
ncbi:MAG: hypothetical protein GWP05_05685 [Anaerolineaceae bacterium]|nr:hypothetical protein [Anaerolineaceae bacterium]